MVLRKHARADAAWSGGSRFSSNMAARTPFLSANDLSGMMVLDSFVGMAGAAPHPQVGGEQAAAVAPMVRADLREIHPRDRGAGVVVAVPVVIQPQRVQPRPGAEVFAPFRTSRSVPS